jgi:predicted RNA-binding protein (TIGR00451 family)
LRISVLSKRDSFAVTEIIKKKWPEYILPRTKSFKVYEIADGKRIIKSENFTAVEIKQNIILPFLGEPKLVEHFPCVLVDMGAVKFVCNGAKIMRPGITKFDIFKKDDIVVVKDEIYLKALATGIATEDSETAAAKLKGYVIDNMHYISDEFWQAHKQIT